MANYLKKNEEECCGGETPSSPVFRLGCISVALSLYLITAFSDNVLIHFSPIKLSSTVDSILISNGVLVKQGATLEAWIAIICWSLSYYFVRRLWNPETRDVTFRKYSADALFGGLAAGASVYLKYYLQARIKV